MMADYVVPRHSAVMERLRRRIELFRRHHNGCENRYDSTERERMEIDRQQTFALHQRCLQTKAKRSNKHRQPQPSSDQRGPGTGGSNADLGDGGTTVDQGRNSTLIALQESVKRKLESAGSPLGREQVNGYPPSKKACLDNGTSNGGLLPPHSPIESKHGIGGGLCSGDSLLPNGAHRPGRGGLEAPLEQEFRLKEMKQEPLDEILPCMLPTGSVGGGGGGGGGSNNLLSALNLNEQEWTELMDELNRSVAYEDIQDILNEDGFEDRKDSSDPTGSSSSSSGGAGNQSQTPTVGQNLSNVKAEFSPATAAFEQQESGSTGSPRLRTSAPGPLHPATSSPVSTAGAANGASGSPVVGQAPQQTARLLQPQNHLLAPPGPVSKDLSPAQQLQQLAAHQRAQQLQNQLQQHKQQQVSKFHPQVPHPPWPPKANSAQNPLGGGGAYGLDKPTSPSLYPQDFSHTNPKQQQQLLMAGQTNKGSPKASGVGGYMQGPKGHPNMLGHNSQGAGGPPLGHPGQAVAPGPNPMLNYSNTKPLSHYEVGAPGMGGPRGSPNTQTQKQVALLSLLRQQQMKMKAGQSFRPQQDQNAYPAAPHGPGPGPNAMATQPGAASNGMAGSHGNGAYLGGQGVSVAMKQQQHLQMMEQQKQQQYLQQRQQRQQQLLAEQEKQRQQQEQQLQRHLTRPPPQYQDQQNPAVGQNPFQQQFTGSSQPMGNVGTMGGPAPGAQRMFPQTQSMLGMGLGPVSGPSGTGVPQPASSQPDLSLSSCGGGGGGAGGGAGGGVGLDVQQVLFNNMNMHPSHPSHPSHPAQQGAMQRQPVGGVSATYRQNMLAQHLKNQPNAALLKQQQLAAAARLPGALPSAMQGAPQGQSQAWQQQQHQGLQQGLPPSTNGGGGGAGAGGGGGGMPPFPNTNAFHLQQQTRLPKMPSGVPGGAPFGVNPNCRPMAAMNPAQQQMMQQVTMVAQQRAGPNPQLLGGQPLGQVLANQQSSQQQQQAAQNQAVLPDLGPFGPTQGNGRQGLQCSQGYQVSRTASQQQQQQQQQQPLPFGYPAASSGPGGMPGFHGDSDLDSLLKGQNTQEWMDDLDELLASQH